MKKALAIAVALLCTAAALMAAQDWRGNNRIAGTVVDKNTGKPVPNAKVMLRIQKGEKGGPDVTTDANGKWAVLGMLPGAWNIDVEAAGYVTRQVSMSMTEGQRLPPMKIEIEPQVVTQPETTPTEVVTTEVKIGGQVVSQDIADAVEAGNAALVAKNYKEAVAGYEKASAALPAFMPIKMALARAYYGAGELKKAIAAMDEVYKSDPTVVQHALLLANMVLEDGQVERGKAIIEKLPADAMTDPTAVINIGIVLMNKKQPAAAVEYFTKAVAMDAKNVDAYYYRGLATIQSGKAKAARADLEKVIELAGQQSGDQYIESVCKTEADKTVCRSRLIDTLAPLRNMASDAKEYLKSIK